MSSNLNQLVIKFANAQLAGHSQVAIAKIQEMTGSWPRIAALLGAIQGSNDGPYDELLEKLPPKIANPVYESLLLTLRADLELRLGRREDITLVHQQGKQELISKDDWNSSGHYLAFRAQMYLSVGLSKPLAEVMAKLRTASLSDPSKYALCTALGECGPGLLQAQDTDLFIDACYQLFSEGQNAWTPLASAKGRTVFGTSIAQWVHKVHGEELERRIDWVNKRFLLLTAETEKDEELSAGLMGFFGRLSNLSHVGALLMDRISEQHPDHLPLQFWYHRSKIAHNIDKKPDQLVTLQQRAVKSLSTYEFSTRIAYHLPFAGISRSEEAKSLLMMAKSLPECPIQKISRKDKNDLIKVVFITAFSSNHGIAHVLHQFIEHLAGEGIEYALINDGIVSEGDIYQERIFANATKVVDVSLNHNPFEHNEIPSPEIQKCLDFIENYEPDAIIHLDGYMNLTLLELMSRRLCPLNIYWIGHGGNLGLDFVDYIINDPFTADRIEREFELEKEIRLPSAFATSGVFEFDDSLNKTDFGFPADAIIINAFNNHMKIDKTYLDAMIRVLRAVPNAILWFNEGHRQNTVWEISSYLKSKGIDNSRYSFTVRLEPKAKHYARLHVSDFAMDTFTVNMASGTLDNIWAELPVISKPGDRYTNRTAGSFNQVIGLDCLNTSSVDEYVERAIELATNQEKLSRLKEHIKTYKRQTSMFDGAKFAKEVAAGISAAVARSREGLPPANIDIPPIFDPIPKFS